MYVHRINNYDMIVEDRINARVRVIYFNKELMPNYWDVEYGRYFVEDFILMLINRTPQGFQKDFIEYSKTKNVFPEIARGLEIKKRNEERGDKDDSTDEV